MPVRRWWIPNLTGRRRRNCIEWMQAQIWHCRKSGLNYCWSCLLLLCHLLFATYESLSTRLPRLARCIERHKSKSSHGSCSTWQGRSFRRLGNWVRAPKGTLLALVCEMWFLSCRIATSLTGGNIQDQLPRPPQGSTSRLCWCILVMSQEWIKSMPPPNVKLFSARPQIWICWPGLELFRQLRRLISNL